MTLVRTCWSPVIVFTDLKKACVAVSVYTVAAFVIIITMTVYMMTEGDSTQLYLPFFENDVRNSLQYYGNAMIYFSIYMLISAGLMILGIAKSLRGLLIPWLLGMFVVIIFQILWSIWLCYGYYIYIEIVIPALIYLLSAAYNLYCWIVVYSQYKIFARMQSPDIELLYTRGRSVRWILLLLVFVMSITRYNLCFTQLVENYDTSFFKGNNAVLLIFVGGGFVSVFLNQHIRHYEVTFS